MAAVASRHLLVLDLEWWEHISSVHAKLRSKTLWCRSRQVSKVFPKQEEKLLSFPPWTWATIGRKLIFSHYFEHFSRLKTERLYCVWKKGTRAGVIHHRRAEKVAKETWERGGGRGGNGEEGYRPWLIELHLVRVKERFQWLLVPCYIATWQSHNCSKWRKCHGVGLL